MRIALFIVTIIGCIIGALLLAGITNQEGAPQQAVVAAVAVGIAVIPYCLARSWQEIGRSRQETKLAEQIGKAVADALRERRS